MDWNAFLSEILPSIVSVVSALCSCVVALARTSTNSILNKLNSRPGSISRSSVTDPKGYYSDSLDFSSYVVVVDGKEIPLSNFTIKRKEN